MSKLWTLFLLLLMKSTTVEVGGKPLRFGMRKALLFIIAVGYFLSSTTSTLYAQGLSEGVAIDVEVADKDVAPGSIISLSEGKYRMSRTPYDPSVFGIVTDTPSVHFEDISDTEKVPIIAYGKAIVRVSTTNGAIAAGDLITTSAMPGVGQKATENGYVIGIAMEDYAEKDPKKVGTIYVTLHLNFGMLALSVRENLIASLQRGATAPFLSPANAFRYTVAAIIAIFSFGGGLWFFGRISSHGVEAIGRNPLARRFILISVVLNVLITLGIMGFGVALAYLILVI